jgi:hypothetical protein
MDGLAKEVKTNSAQVAGIDGRFLEKLPLQTWDNIL